MRVALLFAALASALTPAKTAPLAAAAKAEPSKKPFLVQAGKAKEEPAAEAPAEEAAPAAEAAPATATERAVAAQETAQSALDLVKQHWTATATAAAGAKDAAKGIVDASNQLLNKYGKPEPAPVEAAPEKAFSAVAALALVAAAVDL